MCTPTCGNRLQNNFKAVLERDHSDCNKKLLFGYLQKNEYRLKDVLPPIIKPCCRLRYHGATNFKRSQDILLSLQQNQLSTKDSMEYYDCLRCIQAAYPSTSNFQDIIKRGIFHNEIKRRDKDVDTDDERVYKRKFRGNKKIIPSKNFDNCILNGANSTCSDDLLKKSSSMANNGFIMEDFERFRKTNTDYISAKAKQTKENTSVLNNFNTSFLTPLDILSYKPNNSSRALDKAGNLMFYPEKPSISYKFRENLLTAHCKLEPMKTLHGLNQDSTDTLNLCTDYRPKNI